MLIPSDRSKKRKPQFPFLFVQSTYSSLHDVFVRYFLIAKPQLSCIFLCDSFSFHANNNNNVTQQQVENRNKNKNQYTDEKKEVKHDSQLLEIVEMKIESRIKIKNSLLYYIDFTVCVLFVHFALSLVVTLILIILIVLFTL